MMAGRRITQVGRPGRSGVRLSAKDQKLLWGRAQN